MVREVRSSTTLKKHSKNSRLLRYVGYGLLGAIFGWALSNQSQDQGWFSNMLTTLSFVVLIFIIFYVLRIIKLNKDRGAGNSKPGQNKIFAALEGLSDDYFLLHGLKVTGINNARWEIDHLVMGPNGIFPLEIRSEAGEITPSPDDTEWIVKRQGKRNKVTKKIHNPYLIASQKSMALKEQLAKSGFEADIRPVVVFSDNDAVIMPTELPVVTLKNLLSYIKKTKPEQKLDHAAQKKAAGILLG